MIRFVSPLLLVASTAVAQLPCYDTSLGTNLGLTDDSFSAPLPLGFTFNFGGVAYTDVQVCSNGFIVFGAGAPGPADFTPSITELLNNPEPRICPIWRDLNPAASGGGGVWYNAVPAGGGNPAYFSVTYDGVFQYATSTAITCQILFIDGGGVQIHHDDNVVNGTNTWVLGASPGNGATANPVAFSGMPTPIISGSDTLHETGTGGFALEGTTIAWAPTLPGYLVTPAAGCAVWSAYGSGCVAQSRSVYEHFPDMTQFDLSNTAISGLYAGSGYVMTQGLTTFVPPSAAATNLGLGDDATAVVTPSIPLPYPGGTAATLEVCSNGFISVGANGAPYAPTVAGFLAFSFPLWGVWHDFTPTASNNIMTEEVGGILYVTWDNVPSYLMPGAQSTFQFQFDLSTGFFHIVFQNMNLGPTTWIPDYIVGYTPAAGTADPGSVDLTPVVNGSVTLQTYAADISPLTLASDANPIVNTTINFVTTNITPTAPFGGVLYGLAQFNPGNNLAAIGMPDCFQYNDAISVVLFFPSGASSVSVPFNVPGPAFVGVAIQAQSAIYDPAGAVTPFGALSSNGVEVLIGN